MQSEEGWISHLFVLNDAKRMVDMVGATKHHNARIQLFAMWVK